MTIYIWGDEEGVSSGESNDLECTKYSGYLTGSRGKISHSFIPILVEFLVVVA